jgi:hypothetical protein
MHKALIKKDLKYIVPGIRIQDALQGRGID